MEKMNLSSKVVLIFAIQPEFAIGLKNALLKEMCNIHLAKNLHEAMIHAILTEPDFALIEISPTNFSGFQLPEHLSQIKGFNKVPSFFFFADKKHREFLQQKVDSIFYLDDQEYPFLIRKMKTVSDALSGIQEEKITPLSRNAGPFKPYSGQDKERKILEKLDQLGIIRRK